MPPARKIQKIVLVNNMLQFYGTQINTDFQDLTLFISVYLQKSASKNLFVQYVSDHYKKFKKCAARPNTVQIRASGMSF
jgi:hypothetical protein